MVYVFHVHWRPTSVPAGEGAPQDHPFCADAGVLGSRLEVDPGKAEALGVLLPGNAREPFPSVDGTSGRRKVALRSWRVPALRLAPTEAVQILMEWLEDERVPSDVRLGDSTRYWQRAAWSGAA